MFSSFLGVFLLLFTGIVAQENVVTSTAAPLNYGEIVFIQTNAGLREQNAMDGISQAFDITTKILDVVGAVQPLGVIIAPIARLGELVGSLFGIFAMPPNPIMEKLQEIEKQINRLGQQMDQQFKEMKAFMTEVTFSVTFTQRVSTLHKFMLDTFRFPGNDSIKAFRNEYQRVSAQSLAYTLIEAMNGEATNPLLHAMNADRHKTTKTFEKWNSTLTSIMMQLLYIESFANGMFDNSSLYGPQRVKEKAEELSAIVSKWGRVYKDDYWPTVVTYLMHDIQDQYQEESHNQKSLRLRDGLNSILQDDIYTYYAIVYDYSMGWHRHGFNGTNYLVSFRRGKCNMAVMRTVKSWCPNQSVKSAVEHFSQLGKNNELDLSALLVDREECWTLLSYACKNVQNALAHAILKVKNPAIYATSQISPGTIVKFKFFDETVNIYWIATYSK